MTKASIECTQEWLKHMYETKQLVKRPLVYVTFLGEVKTRKPHKPKIKIISYV